jgi:dTDP-4-dehydrorhamnose 3,5-epimerase
MADPLTQKFRITPTPIHGALIIEHDSHQDDRGEFAEYFNSPDYESLGLPSVYPQANYSNSSFGVLRGLHIQRKKPQGKLVKCLVGAVYDVCVDLRPESPSFMKWHGIYLQADEPKSFWLPPGTAHGFICVSGVCLVHYLCSTIYDKETDGGIRWDDPELDIAWPMVPELMSAKDSNLPTAYEWLKEVKNGDRL